MAPDVVGRDLVIVRQVLGALAGRDDAETDGARPIDDLGGERGLVAIGHGIDDAGLGRFLGQQRAREDVGLDVDHDDVLAGGDGRTRVADAGTGMTCRLDDDLAVARSQLAHGVVGEAGGGDARIVPADGAACGARAVRREIADGGHLEPRDVRDLREEHGPELAGTDEHHAHGATVRVALGQKLMQVHRASVTPPPACGCGRT